MQCYHIKRVVIILEKITIILGAIKGHCDKIFGFEFFLSSRKSGEHRRLNIDLQCNTIPEQSFQLPNLIRSLYIMSKTGLADCYIDQTIYYSLVTIVQRSISSWHLF